MNFLADLTNQEGLIQNIIVSILAAIPTFVFILTAVQTSLGKVKKKVQEFPNGINKLKTEVLAIVKENAEVAQVAFDEMSEEVVKIVDENFKVFEQKTKESIASIQTTVTDFGENIQINNEQINALVKEVFVLMDVVRLLVAQRPDLIKTGAATLVSEKLRLSREDLLKYPEIVHKDLGVLLDGLKEASIVLGEEAMNKFMKELGYEKAKREEL